MAQDYDDLRRRFDTSPYASLLGMKLVDLSYGYAKVHMKVGPQYHNWGKMPHGGLIVSLADQAFGCAVNSMEGHYVAVQFSINFLGVPTNEVDTLVSEARVVHPGKSVGVAEMTVQDSSGRIIARAVGTALAKNG
ncbi:MAG TPA: PaaI family thioesterase [Dehalococcoidia bacterium]|nr:PaaI family thioesterase [Dehalococcoidia bacterium]